MFQNILNNLGENFPYITKCFGQVSDMPKINKTALLFSNNEIRYLCKNFADSLFRFDHLEFIKQYLGMSLMRECSRAASTSSSHLSITTLKCGVEAAFLLFT